MSKFTTFLLTILLAAALFLSGGCQRKDIMDPHEHYNLLIKANFDSLALSQLLSNKSDGYTQPGEPKSVKYIFYEKRTQKVAYKGSFSGLQGGVYLQDGYYDLLLYTSDFNEYDANFFRGMDKKGTAETYTRQSVMPDGSSRSDVTEMYIVEPDPTFAVLHEDILVLEEYENQPVEVEFVQKSFKYYLTIKAKGLHNIHTATMNISGMYTTAYLTHEEHRTNEAGTQSVDMAIKRYDLNDHVGEGELYGEFWSFGPNQREDISNTIVLHFVNGQVITMKLKDLTPQIKTLTRGGEIFVEQKLEIKGPGGGFQPSVGDWYDTNIDLEL